MATRTLDQISDAEWADLTDELYQWLDRVDCAGSVAGIYSLYEALEEQRERALHAARQRKSS